ncbi:putative selenate ABC transporter substrate-binding protein [Nitrogeniibacter mangrovi]|uniref:Putative selenate ABC transporter substrate-binding protein n=1 Tax=Nitrogeniibacter mangrovi TaxID=2016596 RepID=A0A6C1B392_9RHOO|nr:putative selenate ABC transporter substrate-binding protein [Nitrogeniibacter mangrovi]QID17308.1 putative selenate ABC transporter substrate-binding protein [Nitrogeniibacter mangrovi]
MMPLSMRRALLRATAAVMASACFSVPALATDTLRVSAIPDESPTELQRKFAPLGKYLEARLGMPVKFVPVTDYAAVVEALGSGKVDLAWLGGFTYVQAKLRTGGKAMPLVQREQDARFTSKFITARDDIKTFADLKGKRFAFGSPSSTSGHLMPRYFLGKEGINPDVDFANVAFSGAHDATAAFVAAGKVDAGALNASVWDKLVEQGKVDTDKVHVFATTPPYFDYNWTVRGDLDPALQAKIKAAFLALDPAKPADKAILDLQRAKRFIPTEPANYDGIESAARAAGLLK